MIKSKYDNVAKKIELEKALRRINILGRDIEAASTLHAGGAVVLDALRATAELIDKNGGKDLMLYALIKVLAKNTHTPRLTQQIRDALDHAALKAVIAKAFRDMADSLEKFAIHCQKEHVSASTYLEKIEELEKKNVERRAKGGLSWSDNGIEGQKLLEFRSRVGSLGKFTAVCKEVAEIKEGREAAAKAGETGQTETKRNV